LTIKKTPVYYDKPPFSQGFLSRFFPLPSGLAQDVWFLSPGIGAQGGDLAAALQAGLRKDGLGILLPISRGQHVESCGFLSCFPAKVNKK
jgi:hypothetical protein